MEFIVNQQALFTSDIHLLREAQARTEQNLQETQQLITRLAAVTLEAFKDANAKIDALVDSHIRLSESQGRTDETLRNLMSVVEHYFSNRHGRTED
jgi:hypothetical protein